MRKFWPLMIIAIMCIAIAGCSAAGKAVGPSIGTSPQGLEIPIEQAALKFAADVNSNTYKVVGTEELKKWMDDGKDMIIVSALPAADDKKLGTIKGAVNGEMPKTEDEITQDNKDNLLEAVGPDKDKAIVTYCGFVACRRSHHAATILEENGYTNVYRYPGGITAWKEAGNTTAK